MAVAVIRFDSFAHILLEYPARGLRRPSEQHNDYTWRASMRPSIAVRLNNVSSTMTGVPANMEIESVLWLLGIPLFAPHRGRDRPHWYQRCTGRYTGFDAGVEVIALRGGEAIFAIRCGMTPVARVAHRSHAASYASLARLLLVDL